MTNEEINNIYYKCLKYIEKNYKELYIPKLVVGRGYLYDFEIYYNIFSHEFAKAFWGEGRIEHKDVMISQTYDVSSWVQNNFKKWEYHLQQMILDKEPLKYLEKFLKD